MSRFFITALLLPLFLMAEVTEQDRIDRAINQCEMRIQASYDMLSMPILPQPVNGDFALYPDHRGSFAKALQQNPNGFVNEQAFQSLVHALQTGKNEDFDAIILGGDRELVNPQAPFDYMMQGLDSWNPVMPAPPALSSKEMAAEMVELYWANHLRDVPFNRFGEHTCIQHAIDDLNTLSNFTGPKVDGQVTHQTYLRGNMPGDLEGPYISQFLFQPVPSLGAVVKQKRHVPKTSRSNDFMTNFDEWFTVQNGGALNRSISTTHSTYYIRNSRDLADYVHQDFPSQAYINAALILLGYGKEALDLNNPYRADAPQEGFVTFGVSEVLNLISEATKHALMSAWYQKWLVHLRPRPEFIGFLVHKDLTEESFTSGLDSELLQSRGVSKTFDTFGTYFLPQAYPEGSPTHPAYPAGHATISGACATVLKAFFNEDFVIPQPVALNKDNTKLVTISDQLTVGHELNKLASNISLGRDLAGVHYRSDGHNGMILGETVALYLLEELGKSRQMPFAGYTVTKFDGTTVTVGASV